MSVRCPACGSNSFELVEDVLVPRLARAWATDRVSSRVVGRKALLAAVEAEQPTWEMSIRDAIGSESVRFDRCQGCGLEVSSPRRCWPEGEYPEDENYPVRWEFGRFLDDLGTDPVRVLELGAGKGRFLHAAQARGHRAFGLDFNPAAVQVARRDGLEVVHGGFDQLRASLDGRPEQIFDAVAIFHVIEHLPDPASVFKRLSEFVRPGTLLGVSCPGPRRFTDMIRPQQAGKRDFWDYPPHHVLRWTDTALRSFLADLGWEVVASAEEPLGYLGAASQLGITRALWEGYASIRWRKRVSIVAAYARLLPALWTRRGLSLYVLARFRGK